LTAAFALLDFETGAAVRAAGAIGFAVGLVAFAGAAPFLLTFGFGAGLTIFGATFFFLLAAFGFEAAFIGRLAAAFAGRFFGAGFALLALALGFDAFFAANFFFPCTLAICPSSRNWVKKFGAV
jgi:hypothetical protein